MDSNLKKRCDELFALKMKFNGDSYVGAEELNKDFNVHYTEISCDSDEQWERKISELKIELKVRKSITQ